MAEREIIDIIIRYIAVLKENNILFEKVILFGSNINGKPDKWSDIDIAVVAPEFSKDRQSNRVLLGRLAYYVDPRIEVHPIGTYEYEHETWKTIIHEIKTTGLEIAA